MTLRSLAATSSSSRISCASSRSMRMYVAMAYTNWRGSSMLTAMPASSSGTPGDQLDQPAEQLDDLALQRFHLDRALPASRRARDLGLEVGRGRGVFVDADAFQAQHDQGAWCHRAGAANAGRWPPCRPCNNRPGRALPVQDSWLATRPMIFLFEHGVVNQLDRAGLADGERHGRHRIDHHAAQRQDRQFVRDFDLIARLRFFGRRVRPHRRHSPHRGGTGAIRPG